MERPTDEVIDLEATLGNDDAQDSEEEGDDLMANPSLTSTLGLQMVFATPVSRLLPRIRLRTRQAPSLVRNKIVVAIDRWEITSRYPEGHFVSTLGKTESKEAEQESLLLEFDVPYRPFGKVILDCLPPEDEKWVVPPKSAAIPEWRDRADFRDLIICSIDPPDIADVSHFVHLETVRLLHVDLWSTLLTSASTCIPALLGTNLCPLRTHVERLAFSVIWEAPTSRPFTFVDGLPGIEPEQQFSELRMEDWMTHGQHRVNIGYKREVSYDRSRRSGIEPAIKTLLELI
ncbi:hypothetical protein EV424DRAFT_1629608 [Suillus variegatus]|nr:hypothetical protein EV424DRAFT_1629608 [Suillus variegatus]